MNNKIFYTSLLGVLLLINTSKSALAQVQTQAVEKQNRQELPVAKVKIRKELNSSWYEFTIYSEIPEWKVERLEERLVIRYPDLTKIDIDPNQKTVVMELSQPHTSDIINQILYHFKYNGYEEL